MHVFAFDVEPSSTACSLLDPLVFRLQYRLEAPLPTLHEWEITYIADIAGERAEVPLACSASDGGVTVSSVEEGDNLWMMSASISGAVMAAALAPIADKYISQVAVIRCILRYAAESHTVEVVCHVLQPSVLTADGVAPDRGAMTRMLYSPMC